MAARLPQDAPLPGLLRCLGSSMFIPSFEEEGYNVLKDLQDDSEEVVREFVSALGMPNGTDERLLQWAFEGRRGGSSSKHDEKGNDEEESGAADGDDEDEVRDQRIPRCSVFDPAWLSAVAPLYSRHMGCENMGPLLYSLARFVKPKSCLEIGAGYTSAFLLQALEDNARELAAWQQWQAESGIEDWLVEGVDLGRSSSSSGGLLHCVDNLAHEGTTANRLLEVAARLGLESRLALHLDDARAFLDDYTGECIFDFVWLDGFLDFAFAGGGLRGGGSAGGASGDPVVNGLEAFMEDMWPRIAPGGFVLMHSTLTNSTTRAWIQDLATRDSKWGPPGALLSLMEPHKRFQNAVTILQRRPEGYAEPVHSKWP